MGFWSNESSRQNFAGCWLLSTILLVHCQFTPGHDNTHLLIQDCFHMYRQRKVYLPIKVIPCFERRSGSFGFSEAWPHPAQTAWKINKTLQSHFWRWGQWHFLLLLVCLSGICLSFIKTRLKCFTVVTFQCYKYVYHKETKIILLSSLLIEKQFDSEVWINR